MPDGREFGKIGEKGEGIKGINWLLQISRGDIKYSIENIGNNILITMYGVRWVRGLPGGSLNKSYNV